MVLATPLAASQGVFTWDEVTIKGEPYVPVAKLKDYYFFEKMSSTGGWITFSSEKIDMQIQRAGTSLRIENFKFVLSHATRTHNGKVMVSRVDQSKLIDPVLRPSKIREAKRFHTVILDPGHGGMDTGARSIYGHEKTFNLQLAFRVKAELEKEGLRVRMTRTDDSFPTLPERVEYAQRSENAIFVSLHFNSVKGRGASSAHGVETYAMAPEGTAATNKGERPGDDRSYSGNLRDQENIALATAIHSHVIKRTGAADRGIKRDRFTVLSEIDMPAVLLEGGFLTNRAEARKIASSSYQKKMAAAVAEGILKYRTALRR